MMAFRIAWFKVHRPLAFYAAYFSIRAKALDATCMCRGMEVCQPEDEGDRGQGQGGRRRGGGHAGHPGGVLRVLSPGLHSLSDIDLYRSDATKFLMDEEKGTLLPPFTAIPGLGETAAISIVENRVGRTFISQEELLAACPKVSKTHVEQLRDAGALGTLPETSQMSLFG